MESFQVRRGTCAWSVRCWVCGKAIISAAQPGLKFGEEIRLRHGR